MFFGVALGDPLELLAQPTASTLRAADRHLLLSESGALAGRDERAAVWWWEGGKAALTLEAASARLDAVRRFDGPSPDLLGCIAVLQALRGDAAAVAATVDRLQKEAPDLAVAIEYAWLDGAAPPPESEGWAHDPGIWFRTRLAEAIAVRAGNVDGAASLTAERIEAGRRLLVRAAALGAVRAGFVGIGLLVLMLWMVRGLPDPRIADALIGRGWPPDLGAAVLIRGAFWAIVITLVLLGFARLTGLPFVRQSMLALTAGLPFLALVRVRLLAPLRTGFVRALAMCPGPRGLAQSVVAAFPLFALQCLGGLAIAAVGRLIDPTAGHWSARFGEELVWGSTWVVLLAALNTALAVPLVEEIAFRGVLYGTLRERLPGRPAAMLAAATFAAFQIPVVAVAPFPVLSPTGLAIVMWSGLIWAAGYEKTRSLAPCLIAHGATNVLAVLGAWLIFR